MAFAPDTLLSSSARCHIARAGPPWDHVEKQHPSQSRRARLDPLVRFVKTTLSVLGASTPDHDKAQAANDEARQQLLLLRMRDAESYHDWHAAATELDSLEGNDAWKLEDASPEYDSKLVTLHMQQLDNARVNCDVESMLRLIRTALSRSLGGMDHMRLYKYSHVGTKKLIERYISSAVETIRALPEVVAKQGDKCPLKPSKVNAELKLARLSFGRTALLLSGGGTFGMKHIGVIKCLWELNLLPRIISGASAGSIVCAVLCCKTDEEIPALLEDFCYGDLAVFDKIGEEEGIRRRIQRFRAEGSLFDISHLQRVMRQMLGDITFEEAHNRTHRILNITVSCAGQYELPRLLNHITAPDVMIWSAVCTSCSVPFIFNASSLKAKNKKTGKEQNWTELTDQGWIDGSVDNDLPMARLAELFNVNHFIVSQVNPHVVPFLSKEEDVIRAEAHHENSALSAAPGWAPKLASMAKEELMHRLEQIIETGAITNTVSKFKSILDQRYSGDITIFPEISYADFPKILSNPTTDYMLQCLRTGEQATWLKVSRIQNHVAVELALEKAVRQTSVDVHFSLSQSDLRLLNFTRPTQGLSLPSTPLLTQHKRRSQWNSNRTHVSAWAPLSEISTSGLALQAMPSDKDPIDTSRSSVSSQSVTRNARPSDVARATFFLGSTTPSTEASHSPIDTYFSDLLGSDPSNILPQHSLAHSPSTSLHSRRSSTSQAPLPRASPRNTEHTTGASRPAPPSSPERRYKRLFHPPSAAETRRMLQPLSTISSPKPAETTNADRARLPTARLKKTQSLDEASFGGMGMNGVIPRWGSASDLLGVGRAGTRVGEGGTAA